MLHQLSYKNHVESVPVRCAGGILSLETPFEGLDDGGVVEA